MKLYTKDFFIRDDGSKISSTRWFNICCVIRPVNRCFVRRPDKRAYIEALRQAKFYLPWQAAAAAVHEALQYMRY